MEEVERALHLMKKGKSGSKTGKVIEMITLLDNDWKKCIIVPIYKMKGDPTECGNYRGIKLIEHAMKTLEKIVDKHIREIVTIDKMQFGFMLGRVTTGAIFIVRKYKTKT
jgi:hypothetical protein